MPLTDAELDAELIERFNTRKPPIGVLLKSNILEVRSAEGFVRMSYDVGPEFCNPRGTVQGGIIATMLDDACALAAIVKSGQPIFVPTLEFKTSFFAPATAGLLYAEARCLKLGKSVAFMEGDLLDDRRTLLARINVTAVPRMIEGKPNLVMV
jgi:uncharacterized protein (TIGR00369 family)